jgi:DNA polymerase-3 subunit delta'
MLVQSGVSESLINSDLKTEITNMASSITESKTLLKIQMILKARTNLAHNAAPLLTIEALMCELRR